MPHPPGQHRGRQAAHREAEKERDVPAAAAHRVGDESAQQPGQCGDHREAPVGADQSLRLRVGQDGGAVDHEVAHTGRDTRPQQPGGRAEEDEHRRRDRPDP
ncbi:hypothetical protein GCM10009780_50920 [Actinomadura alba]